MTPYSQCPANEVNLPALWGAVLAEAISTWVVLHPDYVTDLTDKLRADWGLANAWLFGPTTDTFDLALAATGRYAEGARLAAREALGSVPPGPARERLGAAIAAGLARFHHCKRLASSGRKIAREGECARCGRSKLHYAKGLCKDCYVALARKRTPEATAAHRARQAAWARAKRAKAQAGGQT